MLVDSYLSTEAAVVIPTQTIGFYNSNSTPANSKLQGVVIPTQTIGFYNRLSTGATISATVVIPTQTIGFYNL